MSKRSRMWRGGAVGGGGEVVDKVRRRGVGGGEKGERREQEK